MTELSQEEIDRIARYRNLFSTTQGRRVLGDMLMELKFFQAIHTEEDRVLSNYAKRLLYLCGGWSFDLMRPKD